MHRTKSGQFLVHSVIQLEYNEETIHDSSFSLPFRLNKPRMKLNRFCVVTQSL